MFFKPFIDIYTTNGFDFITAKSEVYFVFDVLFNYSYKDFILGKKINETQKLEAEKIINYRVKTKKPIQQIVGKSYFYGRLFNINEYTLIPRPETEILLKAVLQIAKEIKNPDILDIGTGSGCIGISLMLENNKIKADMSDIQAQALKIAKQNADLYNIQSNFIFSDLFKNINKKYDIIVSNPPYIPVKDKDTLQIEVKDFEPAISLFANDDDGIEFYQKIISCSKLFIKQKGYIAFELGINQSEKVYNLLKKECYTNINIIKDFNKIDRVITAFYSN